MENKPGEKTPEEYLKENGLDYNSLEMLLLRKEDISIALEMARKSEREKVIEQIVSKLEERKGLLRILRSLDATYKVEEIESTIKMLNLKKEKGE